LRIADLTTSKAASHSAFLASPDTSSADWIAEAPSGCTSNNVCQVLPLSDFVTVRFDRANARTVPTHAASIDDPAFTTTELTLSSGGPMLGPGPVSFIPGGSSEAQPSALSRGGRSFSVRFTQTTAGPFPPPFPASDRVWHAPGSSGRSRR
jgi:hypothetical protein